MDGNLVYYDNMTGLRSREYYDKVANDRFINDEINIVFVDIDNLKKVNDIYGHIEGSNLIRHVAKSLKNLDNIHDVCRIGGDEFIVFGKESFNPKELDDIDYISYGYMVKPKYDNILCYVNQAEKFMYKHKVRSHKKKFKYNMISEV